MFHQPVPALPALRGADAWAHRWLTRTYSRFICSPPIALKKLAALRFFSERKSASWLDDTPASCERRGWTVCDAEVTILGWSSSAELCARLRIGATEKPQLDYTCTLWFICWRFVITLFDSGKGKKAISTRMFSHRRTLDIDYKGCLLPGEVFWYDCMCMGLYSSCVFWRVSKNDYPYWSSILYVMRRCFERKRDTLVWPWRCSAPAVFRLFMRSTCSCFHTTLLVYFLVIMGHKTWARCAVDMWHLWSQWPNSGFNNTWSHAKFRVLPMYYLVESMLQYIHAFNHLHWLFYHGQGGSRSTVFLENTVCKVQMHFGWNVSPSQGTMHMHIYK